MCKVVSLVGDCYMCIIILNAFALSATSLFKMLLKYRPEDKAAKKERLLNKAKAEAEGKTLETKKPIVVKYGINHVTYLIEQVKSNEFQYTMYFFCSQFIRVWLNTFGEAGILWQ